MIPAVTSTCLWNEDLSPGEAFWGHREPRTAPEILTESKTRSRAVFWGRGAAQERLLGLQAQLCSPQLEQNHFSPSVFRFSTWKTAAEASERSELSSKPCERSLRGDLRGHWCAPQTTDPPRAQTPLLLSLGHLRMEPESPGGFGRGCSPFSPPKGKGRAVADASLKRNWREIPSGFAGRR